MVPKTKLGFEILHSFISLLLLIALLITSSVNFMASGHNDSRLDAIEHASRDRLTRTAFIEWERNFRLANGLKKVSEVEKQVQDVSGEIGN